jgi:PAS domain S-box-containing protein
VVEFIVWFPRYRTIFETSEAATIIIGENKVPSLANGRFETLTGYTRDEIEGKLPWPIGVLPEDLCGAAHGLNQQDVTCIPPCETARLKTACLQLPLP